MSKNNFLKYCKFCIYENKPEYCTGNDNKQPCLEGELFEPKYCKNCEHSELEDYFEKDGVVLTEYYNCKVQLKVDK